VPAALRRDSLARSEPFTRLRIVEDRRLNESGTFILTFGNERAAWR
jgi:hypothetical protein